MRTDSIFLCKLNGMANELCEGGLICNSKLLGSDHTSYDILLVSDQAIFQDSGDIWMWVLFEGALVFSFNFN
jgi:hypothetical protein